MGLGICLGVLPGGHTRPFVIPIPNLLQGRITRAGIRRRRGRGLTRRTAVAFRQATVEHGGSALPVLALPDPMCPHPIHSPDSTTPLHWPLFPCPLWHLASASHVGSHPSSHHCRRPVPSSSRRHSSHTHLSRRPLHCCVLDRRLSKDVSQLTAMVTSDTGFLRALGGTATPHIAIVTVSIKQTTHSLSAGDGIEVHPQCHGPEFVGVKTIDIHWGDARISAAVHEPADLFLEIVVKYSSTTFVLNYPLSSRGTTSTKITHRSPLLNFSSYSDSSCRVDTSHVSMVEPNSVICSTLFGLAHLRVTLGRFLLVRPPNRLQDLSHASAALCLTVFLTVPTASPSTPSTRIS